MAERRADRKEVARQLRRRLTHWNIFWVVLSLIGMAFLLWWQLEFLDVTPLHPDPPRAFQQPERSIGK